MGNDAVAAAIRTARESLEGTINFSRGFANQAGLVDFPYNSIRLSAGEESDWKAAREAEHVDADTAYQAAIDQLIDAGYPVPSNWRIYIGEPQVAFSEVPLQRINGRIVPCTWVLGSGPISLVEGEMLLPPALLACVKAGETIGYDPSEANEIAAGAFDDSVVREWEKTLAEIQLEERRLYAAQRTDAPPDPVLPLITLGTSSAEITYGTNTFCDVHLEAAEAFKKVVDAYPRPYGLSKDYPQPRRVLRKLPPVIQGWMDTTPAGTYFVPPPLSDA
jgi:hypothetical protein